MNATQSRRRALLAIGACAMAPYSAFAEDGYPQRPIRLLVGFAAGGTPDTIARKVGDAVSRSLGQPIIVDNRPGADGMIAADVLMKSPPDGYTLLLTTPSLVINPTIYRKVPYDLARDIVPVTDVALGDGYLLVVNPALGVDSVAKLIELGRGGRTLTFSSPGVGNTLYLAAAMFADRAAIQITQVPYKGAGPALNAVMAGDVNAMFIPPTIAVGQIKAAKVRAIGFTAAKRWAELPDVPAIGESLPGFVFDSGWHALFARAGTPAEIVARLNTEFRKAAQEPDVRNFLVQGGYEPGGRPQPEFAAFVQSEQRRYAAIVRAAKLTPQ